MYSFLTTWPEYFGFEFPLNINLVSEMALNIVNIFDLYFRNVLEDSSNLLLEYMGLD